MAKAAAEQLKRIPLFEHLSAAALDQLADIAHEEAYSSGSVLFNEGEVGDSVFLMVAGSALIQRLLDAPTKTYKDLAVVEAGSIFGEMALFDDLPRSATVRAVTDLQVLRIFRDEFRKFLHEDTQIAATVLGGIIGIQTTRLREVDQHLATLYEVSNLIASVHEPEALARGVMERLINAIFHVDAGAFCIWNPYDDLSEVLYSKGAAPDREFTLQLNCEGPMPSYMKANPKPHTLECECTHPLYNTFSLRPGDSLMVAPLVYLDNVLGFILLVGRDMTFTSFHYILASAVCSPVASAITNMEYADDAEARNRLEEAKLRATTRL